MTDVEIPAEDGFPLAATIWEGASGGCVVIAAGVGIRRSFYRHIAEYLSTTGFTAITFDHRGIGDSLRGPIAGADGSMTRWSKLDTNAVVRWATKIDGPLIFLGHSGGGQMLGMLELAGQIDAAVFVTVQSGHWRHWPFPNRYALGLLWYAIMPALSRMLGYFPGKMFRLGENLPSGVALEWSKWGRSPGYLFDHVGSEDLERYENFDRSMLWWSFSDDSYAPVEATRALISRYPSAAIEHRHVRPGDVGRRRIGHFGFFRPESRDRFWSETADWLEQSTAEPARRTRRNGYRKRS